MSQCAQLHTTVARLGIATLHISAVTTASELAMVFPLGLLRTITPNYPGKEPVCPVPQLCNCKTYWGTCTLFAAIMTLTL